MATISIIGWREDGTTWSAWAVHARGELARRLRSAVSDSPGRRRDIERCVKARELMTISSVAFKQLEPMRHILEALGAIVAVDPAE